MSGQLFDSYNVLLFTAGFGGTMVLVFSLYKIFRPVRSRKKKLAPTAKSAGQPKLIVTSSDISAIAGDDVMATQLDLARAYVETGRHSLAKKILEHVCDHGNKHQQDEAQLLLKSL